MKQIYFMLLVAIMLTLGGCFTKWGEVENGSGTVVDQETTIQAETQDEDLIDEVVTSDEDTDVTEIEEENQTSTNSTQQNNNSQTNVESQTTASGTIQDEELESYEEDLEDLFRDILGELDEDGASE